MKQKKETHAQSHCERSVAIAQSSNRRAFTLAEGATHVDTWDNVRKSAFTLAEVLITLAIIGVVAAMTIPTLVQDYKKKVVETKLQKIYSLMNQVILMSEVDNGSKENWPTDCDTEDNITCEEYYQKYILPYIKSSKIENFETNSMGNTAIYLSDGSLLITKGASDYYFYPNAKNYNAEEFYTQTDITSLPSRQSVGKNAFAFRFAPADSRSGNRLHYGKNFDVYMFDLANLTKDEILNATSSPYNYGCNEASPVKLYCTALIKLNNWKIPDDYPVTIKY